ncbi:transposase [Klebsiella quasipneumoniae]|uniref:transposase n=1 Tax=Klebsiella quasipneumoniae TaxID=1463165 RepID=UPI00388FD08D
MRITVPILFRTQLSLLQHCTGVPVRCHRYLDKQIEQCYRQNALCQRIGKILGIGPVTASALIATIGKANNFENGRQLAARLIGSTSALSGGKQVLLGISRRGDTCLRTLLIHGAGRYCSRPNMKQDAISSWANQLMARQMLNTSVALANKNARTAGRSGRREYCAPIISA